MYLRYRNSDARHVYEEETKKQVLNMKKADNLVEHRKNLSNSRMSGSNESKLDGDTIAKDLNLGNIINNKE